MGQRTQILVIKERNNGERKVSFHHHQWGFGRVMYLAAMDLIMQDCNRDYDWKDRWFTEEAKFPTNSRISNETPYIPRWVLEAVSPADFKSIMRVFAFGDNNNGGMVIHVKQDEDHFNRSHFTIGFLLGPEDCRRTTDTEFSRWLTPAEYARLNRGSEYSDDEFVEMFRQFTDYFEVGVFGDNKADAEDNHRFLEDFYKERRDRWEEICKGRKKNDEVCGNEGTPVLVKEYCASGTELDGHNEYWLLKSDRSYSDLIRDERLTDYGLDVFCEQTGKDKEDVVHSNGTHNLYYVIDEGDRAVKLYDALKLTNEAHLNGQTPEPQQPAVEKTQSGRIREAKAAK